MAAFRRFPKSAKTMLGVWGWFTSRRRAARASSGSLARSGLAGATEGVRGHEGYGDERSPWEGRDGTGQYMLGLTAHDVGGASAATGHGTAWGVSRTKQVLTGEIELLVR